MPGKISQTNEVVILPQETTGRIKKSNVLGMGRLPDEGWIPKVGDERKKKFDWGGAPHGALSRPFTQDIIFHGMRRGPNENVTGCRRVHVSEKDSVGNCCRSHEEQTSTNACV